MTQILPLHPLTMEDILQQETREKIETFPSLGYYFIIFRALDETYYKYTSPVTPPANIENLAAASEAANTVGASMQAVEEESKSIGGRARGRVDIVERVGGKEGVEGVGVGAVNLYIVVFADGIVSVSRHATPSLSCFASPADRPFSFSLSRAFLLHGSFTSRTYQSILRRSSLESSDLVLLASCRLIGSPTI